MSEIRNVVTTLSVDRVIEVEKEDKSISINFTLGGPICHIVVDNTGKDGRNATFEDLTQSQKDELLGGIKSDILDLGLRISILEEEIENGIGGGGSGTTLTLGINANQAYWGDKGKIAYDYSQIGHIIASPISAQNKFINILGHIKASENIFDRLSIPLNPPSEMTEGKWYLNITPSGFSGETPPEGSGGGGITGDYLPLTGGTMTGNIKLQTNELEVNNIHLFSPDIEDNLLNIRRYDLEHTIVNIMAPPQASWGGSREATLSLVRGDGNEYFLDLYNMDYGNTPTNNYLDYGNPIMGLRLQKRGNGIWTPFNVEYGDGVNIISALIITPGESTPLLNDTLVTVNKMVVTKTVQMAENINLRLTIPSTPPADMTNDRWYISMNPSGFSGETPTGGSGTSDVVTVNNLTTALYNPNEALSAYMGYTINTSISNLQESLNNKQSKLSGVGLVRVNNDNISYDNSTYYNSNNFNKTDVPITANYFNVGSYNSPAALRFSTSEIYGFGMYGIDPNYYLQATYYSSTSYYNYSRGFRVFNSYDSTQEFFVGHGRLEISRLTNANSEFSSFQNGISFDKGMLNYYHLDLLNNYMRVLDISAYGRTDGVGYESIIRFLTNGDTPYSGGIEVARMWKGCFSIGYTNSTAYTYKLSVAGNAYFSGTVIMAENDNLRLRIPVGTPTNMTPNQWYLTIYS